MAKKIVKENEIDEEFKDLEQDNKTLKTVLIIVGVILVFGLVFFISKKQEDKINKQAGENHFHEISVDKFYQLYESDDKFVLLLGRPGCSHCVAFKPIITNVANTKGVDVYYLTTDNIEELGDWETIWGLVQQEGTPTVAVIENQKLVNSNAGEMTSAELILFLTEAGVL